MSTLTTYSKRLLNPFSGYEQILETEHARAISTDGIHWRIHIRSEIYKTPWQSLAIPVNAEHFFLYGRWSKENELARVPIHPTLYQDHVEGYAKEVIASIEANLDNLPFPAKDRYELWSLDKHNQQPVALLASCCQPDDIQFPKQLQWYFDDMEFTTQAGAARWPKTTTAPYAKDLLKETIHRATGHQPRGVWLERDIDGHGKVIMDNANRSSLLDTSFSVQQLPELFIRTQWKEQDEQHIVQDYFTWLAPILLTIPSLADELRNELELKAQKRPLCVLNFHRLYPQIIDQARMNKVLVEARLRQAST